MRNDGKITVFLSLMISCLLLLCVTALSVASVSIAREKAAIAVRSSISSVKAMYNRYIFDHYHILLFDKTLDGAGEAALEEQIGKDLSENLGDAFEIETVAASSFFMICDDGLSDLKDQIAEAMKYEAVDYGVDKLREKTGGKDGTLSEEEQQKLEAAEQDQKDAESGEGTPSEDEGKKLPAKGKKKDPRKFTKKLKKSKLLEIVTPDTLEVNAEKYDTTNGPSYTVIGFFPTLLRSDKSFKSMSELRHELAENSGWDNALVSGGLAVTYARTFFNSATDTKKNEDTVFDFEQEYLIAGNQSDKDNLQQTVIKISAIRLPLCYACLLKDKSRMAEVETLATALTWYNPLLKVPVKYLIAGCWSYVEAIAETRSLLHGKRLGFIKKKDTWVTELYNLSATVEKDVPESTRGLVYEDYLMILMAMQGDTLYYRMLDLMEFNTKLSQESFEMENAACGLTVDARINFRGQTFTFSETGEY